MNTTQPPNHPTTQPPNHPITSLSFRATLLWAVLAGLLVPLLAVGAASWLVARRAADDLSGRILRHKAECVTGQIAALFARAAEREAVARRFVGDRDLTPDAIVDILAPQANFFDVSRGLAYVGVGNVATGDYGILRRLPGGATGLRLYVLSQEPREVRDFVFRGGAATHPGGRPWDGYDFRTRPFFRSVRDATGPVWTETYTFQTNERGAVPGITLVAPVTRGGELRGVIDVDYEIDELSAYLRQLRDVAPGYAFIVETRADGSRCAVAHPNLSAILDPADGQLRTDIKGVDDDIAKAACAALRPGVDAAAFRAAGTSYWATRSALAAAGGPPWEVVVVVPAEAALGWVPDVLRGTTLILAAVALLAVVAALALARRVARPLVELAGQADALARGEPGGPVHSNGPAELVRLAADFNRMAGEVRAREQTLRAEVAERCAAEERLGLHVRSTPLGVVEFDMDGTVRGWNPAAERIFGYAAAEIVGRPGRALVPRRERATVRAVWERIAERREVVHSENRNVTKDRRVIDCEWWNAPLIDAAGRVVGVAAMVQDVTERAAARAALAASERRFAQAFRASPFPMSLSRAADGVLLDVNDDFCKLFGWTREEAVGRPAIDLGVWHDSAEREAAAQELLLTGRVRERPVRMRTRAGEVRDGRISVEAIDVDGTACAVGAFRDVTEQARAEAALREANATLERRVAERTAELAAANRELEAFSYSVSHDLRAPLRSVDGFAQALAEDYSDKFDAEGRDYLARVRAASRRMGELIDDLLNLSRVSRAEMARRRVDLSAVARQVADALAASDPSRAVEFAIAPGVMADGDANLLKIVLDNLLGNAWKYTGKQPAARVEFGATEADGRPVYFVRDNGAGFDPAYAGKLFQPFQRLHRPDEYEGHGVGLATVMRVVRRHGGRAWAEGAVGRGATFYFTLGVDL